MEPGDLVVVYFDDHVFTRGGINNLLRCKLPAFFVAEEPEHYILASWTEVGHLSGENTDTYTIMKHPSLVIKKAQEL